MWPECRLNGNFFELGFELGWTEDEMVEIGVFVGKRWKVGIGLCDGRFCIRMRKNIGCVGMEHLPRSWQLNRPPKM